MSIYRARYLNSSCNALKRNDFAIIIIIIFSFLFFIYFSFVYFVYDFMIIIIIIMFN